MTAYRVRKWEDFQHYKDRGPPWIRLHRRLLDDYDFHRLPAASRALAPMLWLLASENVDLASGIIEGPDDRIAFRLRCTPRDFTIAVKPLIDSGYIELVHDASNTLASGEQGDRPETEAEKRQKQRQTREEFALPDWIPIEPWNAWLEMRTAKKTPNTLKAMKLSVATLDRLRQKGHAPQAVLEQSIQSGWAGLFELKTNRQTDRPARAAEPLKTRVGTL